MSLAIYLNDHLAVIVGEVELAQRTRQANEGRPLHGFLTEYASQVHAHHCRVAQILTSIGGSESLLKQTAGWLAEKVGRLKLNGALTGYTELARVIELEGLLAAAETRRILWEVLLQCQCAGQIPAGVNCEQSLGETRAQQASLREHHLQAIQTAFLCSPELTDQEASP